MGICSGKIQQSWPLLFPFKIVVNGILETDTLFVSRTCAEALEGCPSPYREKPVQGGGNGWISLCRPSGSWYLWGSRGASPWRCVSHPGLSILLRTELNLWLASGIFVSTGVVSLASVCWFLAQKWELPRGLNSGEPSMCASPIWGYCGCSWTCCACFPRVGRTTCK